MKNPTRLWKTTYRRFNFGFRPTLEQTADVVFKTRIPFDDEHLEKFEEVARKAMLKQNSQWETFDGPIKGSAGWSSILGGSEYIEITRNKK